MISQLYEVCQSIVQLALSADHMTCLSVGNIGKTIATIVRNANILTAMSTMMISNNLDFYHDVNA